MKSQFPTDMLQAIERSGVIAVIVIDDAAHAVPLAKALMDGGVDVIELTLRTDAALGAVREIRQHVPELLTGIGTVLTTDQVEDVVAAGAHFAVSPGLNPEVVRAARQAGLPFAPGVMTPSDIEAAVQLGCRELKFFPAEPSGGLKLLNSIRAPYAHLGIRFVPLGGVNADNLTTWLSNPGVFAVGGSWLAPRDIIQNENWDEIKRRANEARRIADSV